MSITKEQYKHSLQLCIKPILIVILLILLRTFADSLPGSNQLVGELFMRSYVVMAIVLTVSIYVFKIYTPIKTLISYRLTNLLIARRLDDTLETADRFIPIGERLTLTLYLLFTYYYLVPVVKEAGSYFFGLDYGTLSTISDIGVLAASVYVVVSLWRASRPLMDLLVGRVSEKVAPTTDRSNTVADQSRRTEELICPSCAKANQSRTKFCIYCGTSLLQKLTESKKHAGLCPKCNTQNSLSAKFCIECGYAFREEKEIR